MTVKLKIIYREAGYDRNKTRKTIDEDRHRNRSYSRYVRRIVLHDEICSRQCERIGRRRISAGDAGRPDSGAV